MSDPSPEFDPEQFVTQLVAYDDLLAAGKAPSPARNESNVEGTNHENLREFHNLLDLLEAFWPRATASSASSSSSPKEPRREGDTLPVHGPRQRAGVETVSDRDPLHVGRFRLIHELGRGGFGVVYLAFDPKLGRRVALKLPRPEVLLADGLRNRFLREARATASLDHPHIVPVFETGEIGGACYLVSAYCKQGTLAQHLSQRHAPLEVREAAHLAVMLADAVEYARSRGVLHRDLKPGNVLLDDAPSNGKTLDAPRLHVRIHEHGLTPRLADFGLAKFLPGATEADEEDSDRKSPNSAMPATHTGAVLGTPRYMAPEQVEGRHTAIGRATDVYGLGMILYESLAGKPPFVARGHIELIRQVLHEDAVPPRRMRPEVPRDLEAICLKCLEKPPERRYATAAELRADLERFLRGEATIARPLSPAQLAGRWVRRRQTLAALIATFVLATISLFVGLSIHTTRLTAQRTALEQSQEQAAAQAKVAEEHKRLAKDHEFFGRQMDYRQDIAHAAGLWKSRQLTEFTGILDRLRPQAGQKDLRGFEWHYLRSVAWQLTSLPGHASVVNGVRYSRDGRLCASWDGSGVIKVWSSPSGSLKASVECPKHLYAVTFSEDSRRLMAVYGEGTIETWDVLTGRSLTKKQGPRLHPRHASMANPNATFSPDGRELAYILPVESGDEFRVSGGPPRLCLDPSVALNERGAFVVAWARAGEGDDTGILAQRYDETGTWAGEPIAVNATVTGNQFWPSAAVNIQGEFVVTYSSESQGEDAWDVLAQRFNAKGERQGEEIRVNHHTRGSQFGSFAALDDDGNLIVAWHGEREAGAGYDIFACRFDQEGNPLGEEFVVNRNTHGEQTWPTIEMGPNGTYQITWISSTPTESGVSVYAQRFRADGERIGEEILVRRAPSRGVRQAFVTFDEGGKPSLIRKYKPGESEPLNPSLLPLRPGHPESLDSARQFREFQVNTFTAGSQMLSQNSGRGVAMNRAGEAVVVWSSQNQDGDLWGVFAQCYDALGQPVGDEFQVNTTAAGSQESPQPAIDESGNVVIAWTIIVDEGENHIFGRRFDALGRPISDEFRVDVGLGPYNSDPQIGMAGDGSFLIAWRHSSYNRKGDHEVFAQWFNALGQPRGGRIHVCSETQGVRRSPALAMCDSGEAVVVWCTEVNRTIYAQRLSATGELVGSKIVVNSDKKQPHSHPSVTMDAQGNFLVVWQDSRNRDGEGWSVWARRFNAQGEPLGPEFIVNTCGRNDQNLASPAMSPSGAFLIAWQSTEQDGSGEGIFAQHFDCQGKPVGDEFQFNEHTLSDQTSPSVALNDAGRFLVSWTSRDQDGDDDGIFARFGESPQTNREFQVNTSTNGRQIQFKGRDRAVAMNRAGEAAVVWSSHQDGTVWTVFAQRYDAHRAPLGGELQVSTSTAESQEAPQVALDDAGNMVVVWTACLADGSNSHIFARPFDARGVAIGDEFRVDADSESPGMSPQVAFAGDGSFLIAWRHRRTDKTGEDIFAQWHDPQARPRGDRIHVCTEPEGFNDAPALATCESGNAVIIWSVATVGDIYAQRLSAQGELAGPKLCVIAEELPSHAHPSVAMDAYGNFLTVWQGSKGRDGNGWGIFARRYDQQGLPLGPEFTVTTRRSLNQRSPSATMNRNGAFLIVWQSSRQDGSGEGIFAQRFDLQGTRVESEFQVNEHTTGDQKCPNVAFNDVGQYFITWTSDGQDGDGEGIFGRRGEFLKELNATKDDPPTRQAARTRWNHATNRSGQTVIAWSDINSEGSKGTIRAQRYDAQGNALGEGRSAHQLFLANLETGETRAMNDPQRRAIRDLAFSPDKSKLAVTLAHTIREAPELQIIECESGMAIQRRPHNRNVCLTPSFPYNQPRVAFGTDHGHGVVWDWEKNQLSEKPLGGPLTKAFVAISHDGELVASGGYDQESPHQDERVRIWSLHSNEIIAELPPFKASIEDLEFSPDDECLAFSGWDGLLQLCRLPRQRQEFYTLGGHSKEAWCVAFSPDSSILASGSDDHLVKLWEARTGKELATLVGHESLVSGVVFSPDGHSLATANFSGKIRLWEAATGTCLYTLSGHDGPIRSLAWHGKGTLLASGGDDRMVRLWDAASGKVLATIQGHTMKVSSVVFHPHKPLLFTGGNDGAVHLWEVSTPTKPRLVQTWRDAGIVRSLAITRDGRLLAAGDDDGMVRFYSLSSGSLLNAMHVGVGNDRTLAFSADGMTLACGGENGAVTLWHVAARRELFALPGVKAQVNSLIFSHDGQTLVAATHDGAVTLWRGEHQP